MKKYMYFLIPLIVLVVILYIAAQGSDLGNIETDVVDEIDVSDDTFNSMNQAILQAMQDSGATAVTVALGQNGSILYNNYYGVANRADGTAITYANSYAAGRLSQLVTMISFAKLAETEDITLDLDAQVTDYLPEFTMADERYQSITMRMLLTHKSGIPDSGDTDRTAQESLVALADTELSFDPGTEALYSKENYDLLELVLETVYGDDFTAYQEDKTFTIIKMKASFYANNEESLANIATFYNADGVEQSADLKYAYASNGLYTNAIDLCLLSNALNASRQYLSEAAIDTMITENWGLLDTAVEPFAGDGIEVIKAESTTDQSRCFFMYLPEQRISLALTVQGPMENGDTILEDFLTKVLQENDVLN